jgi:peptide/nickel transport system substrate-binding protein
MKRILLLAVLSAVLAIALAACGEDAVAPQVITVEKEVIVEREVIKEVPVEVIVEKEVVKEVRVPGETIVVTKEVQVERFGESPLLTQLVSAGKLPPVEDRLPVKSDIMVIPALRDIGKYGGTLRRVLIGPGDVTCNVGRVNGMSAFRYTMDGSELMPHAAKGMEPNADGSEWIVTLREGLRWSDGAPFTADDWVFSWKDILMNEDLTPNQPLWVRGPGPDPVTVTKIDDTHVKYNYPSAFWTLPRNFAGACNGPFRDEFVPAHYVKQFHKDFNPNADQLAKDAGFDSWVLYLKNRYDVRDNPERPTNQPWWNNNKRGDAVFFAKRNPYYWAVDQEGNQLPYIDELRFEMVDSVDVLMLKAVQGEIDFQMRHMQVPGLPVLKQGEEKGGYTVKLYKTYGGVDAYLGVNHGYAGPAGDLLRNKDFRIALSIALDREFMKEVNFVGIGEIRNAIPPKENPHYPGEKYEKLHTEFDVAKANELLDKVMGPKDNEGFRTLPDGSRFELDVNATAAFGPFVDIAEQAAQFWKKVGVRSVSWSGERSLFVANGKNNEQMVSIWMQDYTNDVYSAPNKATPVRGGSNEPHWGPSYGIYWATGGESGIKPPPEIQRLIDIVELGPTLPPDESAKLAQELYAWHAENQVLIPIVGHSIMQGVTVVNKKLMNVPDSIAIDTPFNTPFDAFPEQFWFRQ